jgi:hypothetical protein
MDKFKYLNLIREKVKLIESDLSLMDTSLYGYLPLCGTKRVGLKYWASEKWYAN